MKFSQVNSLWSQAIWNDAFIHVIPDWLPYFRIIEYFFGNFQYHVIDGTNTILLHRRTWIFSP